MIKKDKKQTKKHIINHLNRYTLLKDFNDVHKA